LGQEAVLSPIGTCVLAHVAATCEARGVANLRAGAEQVAVVVMALSAFIRCLYDAEARPKLQLLFFILPVVMVTTRMTRSLGHDLADSQQRLLEECSAKEAALSSLRSSQAATSRVLQGLCNVVIQVDADFCLQQPTWQVRDLLDGSCSGDPQALEGSSLLDFMATDEAVNRFRLFITNELEQASGRLAGPQQGPASVISVEMKDLQGVPFTARLYHACLGDSSSRSHLLGVCLAQDIAMQRAPPLLNDANLDIPWNEFQATLAQIHHMRPRLQRAAASSSASDSQAENPNTAFCDLSSIAVRFDAGTASFECTRDNVLIGPLRRKSRRVGLLHMLGDADVRAMNRWVVDEVHDQEIASRRGEVRQPAPFPGTLTFKLPKPRLQVMQAERVRLLAHDATRDEEVPVTLWLHGIKMLTRSQALAVLNEEDVDVASESESESDIEHESVSQAG